MKSVIIICMLLLSMPLCAQHSLVKDIEVKEATIYLQGAKIYGETNITLKEGRNLIKIVHLPNDLNDQTYKVHLQKHATLLSVTPQINHLLIQEKSKEELLLGTKSKQLENAIALLDIELKTITGEQAIINNHLKIQPNDKIDQQTQLEKLTAFYSQRMQLLDKKQYQLALERNALSDSLKTYADQLASRQTYKSKNQKELLLEIVADKAMSFDLGLSYLVNNAGWKPNYDLKVVGMKQSLELIYKGQIYQRTGQDWKNIKLWVSTYKPLYNQHRPILSPMYVAEYVAYQAAPAEKKLLNSESNVMANAYQLREDMTNASIPVAETQDAVLNMLYELNYQQTLLSQDNYQFVMLDKRTLNAQFKYHAVPKVSQQVYLMAFIKNWQQLNLITGEANIFFEDNYVGKTTIQSEYLNDELPISLGVDERIVMKRVLLNEKVNNKNNNANKWETIAYQISIRNGTKDGIPIEILDQLPISENNKVAVKPIDLGNGKLDEKTGSILWERTIASGGNTTILFSYEVKYPKDMKVYYFNR